MAKVKKDPNYIQYTKISKAELDLPDFKADVSLKPV
jgi:hypothetical protein